MRIFALLAIVAMAQAEVDWSQVIGLKRLLKNMDGVYATCNLILFKEMVDYETAEKNCENFDIGMGKDQQGNLATVNDAEKNMDIKILLGMAYEKDMSRKWDADQWVWAGLRKVKNNIGKISKAYDANDWNWADGETPSDFHKWLPKMPDQRTKKKDGVKYYQNQMRINHNGRWDDTFSYMVHPYACDYQGKYILSATLKTWHDAKKDCESAGLTLAKVRNAAEVQEMVSAAKYFLGPRDPEVKVFHKTNWLWLGGNDLETEGVWQWTDGSSMEEFDGMVWRKPNPDNAEYIGDVGQDVLSFSKWGEFDDSFDTKRKRPFACQCPGT